MTNGDWEYPVCVSSPLFLSLIRLLCACVPVSVYSRPSHDSFALSRLECFSLSAFASVYFYLPLSISCFLTMGVIIILFPNRGCRDQFSFYLLSSLLLFFPFFFFFLERPVSSLAPRKQRVCVASESPQSHKSFCVAPIPFPFPLFLFHSNSHIAFFHFPYL